MPCMIALLRGVNVGNNILRMERLRELCGKIGMKNVRTYVQSGNVVFEAPGGASEWAAALERKLAGETRLPVSVVVRTPSDLRRILDRNPLLKERGIDEARLHVTMLAENPARSVVQSLPAQIDRYCRGDRYVLAGRDIYLHCPNGYGQSKLTNSLFEKLLEVRATTRNWNTVNSLYKMTQE